MPTVNVYYKGNGQEDDFRALEKELKIFIAEKLSVEDKKLSSDEVSVRLVNVEGDGMIGSVEVEITAHAYPARVEKQDEICNDVRKYIEEKYPGFGEVRVWLILSELGHSW